MSENTVNFSDKNDIFFIKNEPVMKIALDVLEIVSKKGRIILRAHGQSIPNAVAAANIITEKMLKNRSIVKHVKVDSLGPAGIGKLVSTIEIILEKTQ